MPRLYSICRRAACHFCHALAPCGSEDGEHWNELHQYFHRADLWSVGVARRGPQVLWLQFPLVPLAQMHANVYRSHLPPRVCVSWATLTGSG